jgi:hypothetical protein
MCGTCLERFPDKAALKAHRQAVHLNALPRASGFLRPCNRCNPPQLIPAGQWESHRQQCYDARSERKAHTSSAGWGRLRAQILERDGHQCQAIVNGQRCGSTEELECCHLDGNWQNDVPRNLTIMCRPHHRSFDAEHFPRLDR